MADNDAPDGVTHVGPSSIASPTRKGSTLLYDGVWYVTVPCAQHGTPSGHVDEAVTWAEAKTPHHAGLIADLRHHACNLQLDAQATREAAAAEIAAAEQLLAQQEQNLARATEDMKAAFLKYKVPIEIGLSEYQGSPIKAELEALQRLVARHEHGLHEARRRVAETRTANAAVV